MTLHILRIEVGKAYIKLGKMSNRADVYELSKMNADYAEMLSELKIGIPVIGSWVPDCQENVPAHGGYMLTGFDQNNRFFYAEVIRRSGNCLTVRRYPVATPKNSNPPKESLWSLYAGVFSAL